MTGNAAAGDAIIRVAFRDADAGLLRSGSLALPLHHLYRALPRGPVTEPDASLAALSQLPFYHRAVLALVAIQAMTSAEAAAILVLPEPAVTDILKMARLFLLAAKAPVFVVVQGAPPFSNGDPSAGPFRLPADK